ncbi:hypothetical protein RND81_11G239100 [Saponaria officinalis]|uniref:Secreted protein n=1 Tax=Saponaria officinalis TaxID=3572 RepID=A0AAW1HQX1_SAPOF
MCMLQLRSPHFLLLHGLLLLLLWRGCCCRFMADGAATSQQLLMRDTYYVKRSDIERLLSFKPLTVLLCSVAMLCRPSLSFLLFERGNISTTERSRKQVSKATTSYQKEELKNGKSFCLKS